MIAGVLENRTGQLNAWIIDQLRLQPYQHVLETGCGAGHLLAAAAGSLRIGFLAGLEPSAALYQQACRRNRRFIARQLVQLHLGGLADLPYPPHYFHTLYSQAPIASGKDRIVELLRLTRLLRSGGRLVLVFRPGAGQGYATVQQVAQDMQQHYVAARLHHIRIEHRETTGGAVFAAIGVTP